MSDVQTLKTSEALNHEMNWKFYVLAHELPGIENYVDTYITVNLGDAQIHGQLKKVSTWVKKDHGETVGVYKIIEMKVIRMMSELEIDMVDKKDAFGEAVTVSIGVV